MAIEIISNSTSHGPHHDLESVYWLLVWMILRHTTHTHTFGALACSHIFDAEKDETKRGFINKRSPVDESKPLFDLVEALRDMVIDQNPPASNKKKALARTSIRLTHDAVLKAFLEELASPDWPTIDDPALAFQVPSILAMKNEKMNESNALRRNTLERQAHKRSHVDMEGPVEPASSEGTTAASSGSKKAKMSDPDDSKSPSVEKGSRGRRVKRGRGQR